METGMARTFTPGMLNFSEKKIKPQILFIGTSHHSSTLKCRKKLKSFPGYKGNYLTTSVKIMGAYYDLTNEMQEARASSATILTHFAQNILVGTGIHTVSEAQSAKELEINRLMHLEKKKKKMQGLINSSFLLQCECYHHLWLFKELFFLLILYWCEFWKIKKINYSTCNQLFYGVKYQHCSEQWTKARP